MNERKLPLGEQDFERLISKGFAYVDKTALIYELANGATYNFLSRPRRFGKSLMISTLKEYFQGKKELFEGLAVEKLESDKGDKAWQEHVVFHFDFSSGDYVDDAIKGLYTRMRATLEPIEAKYKITVNEADDYSGRFLNAMKVASEKSGNEVVILIDEYDAPLFQSLESGKDEPDNVRNKLKAFYATLKTANPYIRFAILTGVTRFSQMSVFSGLNQLNDISFQKPYSAICGITQTELETNFKPEIKLLAENNNLTYNEALDKMKDEYDGYDFTGSGLKVYNPFSTINVLANSKFKNYWFQTGTPTFLVKEISKTEFNIPSFEYGISTSEDAITSYRPGTNDIVPLLFQTGYLTIKDIDDFDGNFILGFPNNEVKYGFYNSLAEYFIDNNDKVKGLTSTELIRDLRQENIEDFFSRITAFYSGIPYDLENKKEVHYQTIFYVLLAKYIKVEEHTATGSADAIIELPDQVYIFEFKMSNNGSAKDAIQQIDDKGYAKKYNNPSETRKIYKVGVVFDNKLRTIVEYLVNNE